MEFLVLVIFILVVINFFKGTMTRIHSSSVESASLSIRVHFIFLLGGTAISRYFSCSPDNKTLVAPVKSY